MKKLFLFIVALWTWHTHCPAQLAQFHPGEVWNDTENAPINAHGGCVVFHNGTYYWFGEDRTKFESNGVSCYSSTDLYNWKRIGLALKTDGQPREDLNDISQGRLFERPKVIYNPKVGDVEPLGKIEQRLWCRTGMRSHERPNHRSLHALQDVQTERKRIARPNIVRGQRRKSLPYLFHRNEHQHEHRPPA